MRIGRPDPGSRWVRLALILTRALLLLYPPSFRSEMGTVLTGDVRGRAAAMSARGSAARTALWLTRHVASLLGNVPGAWMEGLWSG